MARSEEFLVGLRRIIRATDFHAKAIARRTGMTPSQLLVLQTIGNRQSATIGELATEMNLSQATVTTLVDRLQNRDLVRRQRSDIDRRKVDVFPTEAGLLLLATAPAQSQQRLQDRFEALPEWEQGHLLAALERIAALMDAKSVAASPVLDIGPIDRESSADETQSDPLNKAS